MLQDWSSNTLKCKQTEEQCKTSFSWEHVVEVQVIRGVIFGHSGMSISRNIVVMQLPVQDDETRLIKKKLLAGLYIHCESEKLDPFSFDHNCRKYCPIFTARCYASAAYVVMWCMSVCVSVNQSVNQKRIRVTKVTNVTAYRYYSGNK